jgi:SAM-dependent methyltransferase
VPPTSEARLRERRRRSFDVVAATYATYRPQYPAASLELITRRLGPGARLLEVGPGPGLATLPLAELGYRIMGVEAGANLAREAQRRLAAFDNVEIVHSPFEQWRPTPPHAFDLVLAASSWHWIEPAVKYERAWLALREGGSLALLANHPRPGRPRTEPRRFWEATDAIYRTIAPALVVRRGARPPILEDLRGEIRRSGRFQDVERHLFEWRREYSAADYVGLLDTYSDHRTLPSRVRARLYRAIEKLSDREFGGRVPRFYRTVLHLAASAPA